MTDGIPAEAEQRLRRRDVALLLLATVPFFLNLGWLQAWGSEQRWLSIAREMRASGHWLEPTLEGEFYGDKPLLSYWAIVAASWITGGVNEAAGRLPSAIAGLATVLLTGWLAARLRGRGIAVLAGLVVATAFSFHQLSRKAEADLLNVAFCTGAIAAHVAARERCRAWHAPLFGILIGLGGNSKGVPAIVLPIAVAAADMALSRSWGLLRRPAWAAVGAAAGLAIYFAPFLLSFAVRGDWKLLELMWRENFVRALDSFDHDEAGPLYYFYVLPAMLAPWTLCLPGAVAWAAARFRKDAGLRFALLAFAVIFAAFTASESRRSYYILPIVPFSGVTIAAFWDDAIRSRPSLAWRALAWAPLALIVSVVAVAAAYLLVGRWLPGKIDGHPIAEPAGLAPYGAALGAALAMGAAAAFLAWRAGEPRRTISAVAAIALAVCVYLSYGGDALRARGLVERDFAASVRAAVGAREVVSFKMGASRLRYYLGPGRAVLTAEDLRKLVDEAGPRGVPVVCEPMWWTELEKSPAVKARVVQRAVSPPFGTLAKAKERYVLGECFPP